MGAWGHRSFQNDAAQDWLLSAPSPEDVRQTVELGVFGASSLATKDCERLVAACELVAAATGACMTDAPPRLSTWASKHRAGFTSADVNAARLGAIAIATESRLQALFDDEDRHEEWHVSMDDLIDRLAKAKAEPKTEPAE